MEADRNCPCTGYGSIGGDIRGRFYSLFSSYSSGDDGGEMGQPVEKMDMEGEDD